MNTEFTTDQLKNYEAALAAQNFIISRAMDTAGRKIDGLTGAAASATSGFGIDTSPVMEPLGQSAKEQLGQISATLASSMQESYPQLTEFFEGFDSLLSSIFEMIYKAVGYTPEQQQLLQANPASVKQGLQTIASSNGIDLAILEKSMNEGMRNSVASLSQITESINGSIKEMGLKGKTGEELDKAVGDLAETSALRSAGEIYNSTYSNSFKALKEKNPGADENELRNKAHTIASQVSGVELVATEGATMTFKPVRDAENHATGVFGLIFDGAATKIYQSLEGREEAVQVTFRLPDEIVQQEIQRLPAEDVEPGTPPAPGNTGTTVPEARRADGVGGR